MKYQLVAVNEELDKIKTYDFEGDMYDLLIDCCKLAPRLTEEYSIVVFVCKDKTEALTLYSEINKNRDHIFIRELEEKYNNIYVELEANKIIEEAILGEEAVPEEIEELTKRKVYWIFWGMRWSINEVEFYYDATADGIIRLDIEETIEPGVYKVDFTSFKSFDAKILRGVQMFEEARELIRRRLY